MVADSEQKDAVPFLVKYRGKHDLEEYNLGLPLTEQAKLALVLKKNKKELNAYVEQGSVPLFGYPPVLYSPISANQKWDTLRNHVICSNESKSVYQIIKAANDYQSRFNSVAKKF